MRVREILKKKIGRQLQIGAYCRIQFYEHAINYFKL